MITREEAIKKAQELDQLYSREFGTTYAIMQFYDWILEHNNNIEEIKKAMRELIEKGLGL